MSRYNQSELEAGLHKKLGQTSYDHCLRTAETAVRLARMYEVDESQAATAGLMHDVAKDMPDVQLIEQARSFGMKIDPVEACKPYLLHASVGARILALEFGIADETILGAVAKHTFGDTIMNKLDRIVYLADVIEPDRDFAGLDEIRRLTRVSLDEAFAAAYKGQLLFIIEKGGYLHPRTLEVWNSIASEVGRDSGIH